MTPRKKKKKCKKGHDLTDPANIYVYPGTDRRECLTCRKARYVARDRHPDPWHPMPRLPAKPGVTPYVYDLVEKRNNAIAAMGSWVPAVKDPAARDLGRIAWALTQEKEKLLAERKQLEPLLDDESEEVKERTKKRLEVIDDNLELILSRAPDA